MSASHWRPLLTGERKDRALAAVARIASDLRARFDGDDNTRPVVLGTEALVFHYLALTVGGGADREVAARLLDRAADLMAELPLSLFLFSGVTGVAWAAEHVNPRPPADEDPCVDVDAAVAQFVTHTPWRQHYDLIGGLVGLGVYCLQRRHTPAARAALEGIVVQLARMASPDADGLRFWTAPEHILTGDGPAASGCHDLGVAHGVAGVIALLAEVEAAGLASAPSRRLLGGSVSWLLAQRSPTRGDASFGSIARPESEWKPARLAWCYGDLGIAVALLKAARATANAAWEATAVELARGAARRPAQGAGVIDACFCHGAAGVAHLFNRLYQATEEPALAQAALYWFDRALEMQRGEGGFAGYLSYAPCDNGKPGWTGATDVLFGVTGIALALLAAVTDVDPRWDDFLLVGLEPRGGAP